MPESVGDLSPSFQTNVIMTILSVSGMLMQELPSSFEGHHALCVSLDEQEISVNHVMTGESTIKIYFKIFNCIIFLKIFIYKHCIYTIYTIPPLHQLHLYFSLLFNLIYDLIHNYSCYTPHTHFIIITS